MPCPYKEGLMPPAAHKKAGGPSDLRRPLQIKLQPQGNTDKKAEGRCLTLGGLRCSYHLKKLPLTAQSAVSMGSRGSAPGQPMVNLLR